MTLGSIAGWHLARCRHKYGLFTVYHFWRCLSEYGRALGFENILVGCVQSAELHCYSRNYCPHAGGEVSKG